MNEIFLSYDREDRAFAQRLAGVLHAQGLSVWWDREIPFGKAFDLVIEEQLNAARCVIVVWSKQSVRSRWVKTEAGVAADRGCLLPVLIEDTSIPLEFRRIQTAMMQGWDGDAADPEFVRLVNAIRGMLGASAQAIAPTPPADYSPRRFGWRAKLALTGVFLLVLGIMAFVVQKNDVRSLDESATQSPPASDVPIAQPPTSQANTQAPGEQATAPAAAGEIAIKIGDMVSDGIPRPGAGNIEKPGTEDAYRFSVAAGQRVFFHMFEHEKSIAYLKWRLADPDGVEVFNTCLGCGTPGLQLLRKAGTYALTVGSPTDPATGIYRFKLFSVAPPAEYSIKVGDMVKEDVPAPGAGNIQGPGAENIYKFTVPAGQRIYFHMFEHDRAIAYVRWKLIDPDGVEVFNDCLGCSSPGLKTLRKPGTYALRVGNPTDPSTGVYRFRLFSVPAPSEFSVKVGDTVKEHVPAAGAGNIETPGAEDIYKFTAAPGQRVNFQMLEHEKGMSYIRWKLSDQDGMELFDACLGCGSPGMQTLRKGGVYLLKVGNPTDPATGVYRFQITNVAGPAGG